MPAVMEVYWPGQARLPGWHAPPRLRVSYFQMRAEKAILCLEIMDNKILLPTKNPLPPMLKKLTL